MTITKYFLTLLLLVLALLSTSIFAKNYKGAELRTRDTFTYGRFEVRYIPAKNEGVVSSFFTYHEISSSSEWNEIDFEFIGRYDNNIQLNVIAPGQTNHVASLPLSFNPYTDFHTYAFEWTPDYIAWFVDGVEIHRQTEAHIATINRDQKIMMNIWPPAYTGWVGSFDPETFPARAYYDWVSYSSYTPGQGDTGTDNDFTFQWKDEFNNYDSNRWSKGTHTWNGNESDFVVENVQFKDGIMILCLTNADETGLVDNQPPKVLWVKENSRNQVFVRFGEKVNKQSAEDLVNYLIPGVTLTSANLSDDGTVVTLETEGYDQSITYNAIIKNVGDDEDTPNIMSTTAKTITQTNTLDYPIKINVGGDATGDYLADQEWQPELQYGYLDGTQSLYPGNYQIGNTDNQAPYRSDRYGMVEYRVNVPRGVYNVTLQFAEKYFDNTNERVFDVYLEDQKVAEDLDVLTQAGKNNAYEIESEIFVDDDRLDIYFTNEIDNSILSGIIIEQITTDVPQEKVLDKGYKLNQNYPNPFNPSTTIEYTIDQRSFVSIKIYDVLGREVTALNNKIQNAGTYSISFDASELTSGVYFYKLFGNEFTSESKKMIYLK